MARVLSTESRMQAQERAVAEETRRLRRLGPIEWGAAALLAAAGVGWYAWKGSAAGLVLAGAAAFLGFGHRLKARENERDRRFHAAGWRGEHRVARTLAENLPADYALINDAEIVLGRSRAQFDHVVVGPNGVFAVETKNWRGHVTGHRGSMFLRVRRDDGTARTARNPLPQCRRQARVLRAFLARSPRPDAEVAVALVSGSDNARWDIAEADIPIVSWTDIAAFIRGRRTEHPLSPGEVDRIAQAVLARHAGVNG